MPLIRSRGRKEGSQYSDEERREYVVQRLLESIEAHIDGCGFANDNQRLQMFGKLIEGTREIATRAARKYQAKAREEAKKQ